MHNQWVIIKNDSQVIDNMLVDQSEVSKNFQKKQSSNPHLENLPNFN
jgi:hypothetical protein